MINPGKQRLSSPARAAAPLQAAAAHAGGLSADASSPRQLAQGAQIAQLERKTKGHSRGASHSKTGANGKTTSHQPGKARTEDPRKSAAKNRKRDRLMQANVANSIAKGGGK